MNGDRHEGIVRKVEAYYSAKVATHGATHCGVDWNSTLSQELRFAQLLRIAEGAMPASINDFGCGYGALAEYLRAAGSRAAYCGYDISPRMVAEGRARLRGLSDVTLTDDLATLPHADITVASGIFNVRLDVDDVAWLAYIHSTLSTLAGLSERGFAFNMLTGYSDEDRKRRDLYYADPHAIFDYCRTTFSRQVALLHDYPLYEFTIHVRLPV